MEASVIYLVRGADESLVEAVLLDDLDKPHLEQLEATWAPVVEQVKRTTPRDRWPEDWHWNWRDKLSHAHQTFGQRGFCITCEGGLQGAMLVDLASLSNKGTRSVLYVDYLAVAPWNRSAIQTPKRFKAVGGTLIAAAVQLSIDEGFKGRIGLHSLPGARRFYEKNCGMTIIGPDPQKQNLTYYEFTSEQANAFLAKPLTK
ncbi:MAG TPA: GNAT family N-acetyltransferase [Verrucomicrobiota bacterium]|nr:GNAT family N-acetyltransferase [Verrucomicrobiota bacterium]